MPPRRAAIVKITEHLLGGPVTWTYGEVRPRPMREHSFVARDAQRTIIGRAPTDILDQTTWDDTEDLATELWEKLVNAIDWNRVLITACGRHLELQKQVGEDNHPDHVLLDEVCSACVRFALLTKER